MDEYISKKQAVDLLKLLPNPHNLLQLYTIEMAIYSIENEPAADVQPVRHGQWIECCNELDKKCSCCCKVHGTIYGREPFCPNCGARMDLKDGNTNE